MSGPESGLGAARAHGSAWRKASCCASGECVEVSDHGGTVLMRDSARTDVAVACTRDSWLSFIGAAKAGEFDLQRW